MEKMKLKMSFLAEPSDANYQRKCARRKSNEMDR